MARNVLLVGSLGLEDAETAFRSLAKTVGRRASRYPDGEPGARKRWIMWQALMMDGHPQFVPTEEARLASQAGKPLPVRRRELKPGVAPADVTFDNLGYADEAIGSYAIFRRLKAEGAIPAKTRMQVSLPTPVAFVCTHIVEALQSAVEAKYERAMRAEIEKIVAHIPPTEVAIQWDVAHEVCAIDGGMKINCTADVATVAARMARLCSYVPEPAELGIHICYGDPGHKHIVEPKDAGTSVALINRIVAESPRQVNWVHIPVPRDRNDDAFFAPLKELKLKPGTELFLGLIHYTDGLSGTQARMVAAERWSKGFGVACECGFGRRNPATIADLLTLHATVADAG